MRKIEEKKYVLVLFVIHHVIIIIIVILIYVDEDEDEDVVAWELFERDSRNGALVLEYQYVYTCEIWGIYVVHTRHDFSGFCE